MNEFSVVKTSNWIFEAEFSRKKENEKSHNRQLNIMLFFADHLVQKMHRIFFHLRLHSKFEIWKFFVTNHCFNIERDIEWHFKSKVCTHQFLTFNDEVIKHEQKYCLIDLIYNMWIDDLSYFLRYIIEHVNESFYVKFRNVFFKKWKLTDSKRTMFTEHQHWSAIFEIFFEHDNRNDLIKWRFSINNDAFAIVYFDFNFISDDLRVIKEWNCKTQRDDNQIWNEINVCTKLNNKNCEKIIKIFDWHNEMIREKRHFFSIDYYLIMKTKTIMNSISWSLIFEMTIEIWKKRKTWFRQLLLDLKEIHSRDWIHRNIIAQNIIWVFEVSSIRFEVLKLTNFDKLCKISQITNEHLIFKDYRVFEVDDQTIYNQFIDI